jgi:hypothetical protein
MALSKTLGSAEIYKSGTISSFIKDVSLQDIVNIINSSTSNNLRKSIFGSSDIVISTDLIKIASHSKFSRPAITILNDIVGVINNSESFTKRTILGSRKITLAQLLNIIRRRNHPLQKANINIARKNIHWNVDRFEKANVIDLSIYRPNANIAPKPDKDKKQNGTVIDIDSIKKIIEEHLGHIYDISLNAESDESIQSTLLLEQKEGQEGHDNMQNLVILQDILRKALDNEYIVAICTAHNLPPHLVILPAHKTRIRLDESLISLYDIFGKAKRRHSIAIYFLSLNMTYDRLLSIATQKYKEARKC